MNRLGNFNPRSVEEVFKDFKGRRTALLRALTTDFDEVYEKCDPEKDNLCLYGHPGEQWEVKFPCEDLPPVVPEPVLGINFARDGMEKNDWHAFVARHCDNWLLAVAFCFSLRFGHDKADRTRLFNLINGLPTITELLSGKAREPPKRKKPPVPLFNDDSKPKRKYPPLPLPRYPRVEPVCGECNKGYLGGELWIRCCLCQTPFHLMKCLNLKFHHRFQPLFCSSCIQGFDD